MSSKLKMDGAEKVLEQKYVPIEAPILASTSAAAARTFLEEYEVYEKARNNDKLSVLSKIECIHPKLMVVMQARPVDAAAVKSEEAFMEYLKSKNSFSDPSEVMDALSRVVMQMSIHDVEDRIDSYDMDFFEVKSRSEQADYKIRASALCEAYIAGIRPPHVQNELKTLLRLEKIDLPVIMQKARAALIDQQKRFLAYKPVLGERREKKSQPAEASSSAKPSASDSRSDNAHKYELRSKDKGKDNICRRCGVAPYTIEHFKECCKAHPSHPSYSKKKVEEVHMVSDKNQSENDHEHSIFRVMIQVGDGQSKKSLTAKIDSGATRSCISGAVLKKIQAATDVHIKPKSYRVRVADGRIINIDEAMFSFSMPGALGKELVCEWRFGVLPDDVEDHILLGEDIIKEVGMPLVSSLVSAVPSLEQRVVDEEDGGGICETALSVDDAMTDDDGEEEVPALIAPTNELLKQVKINEHFSKAEELRQLVLEYSDIFNPKLPAEGAKFEPMHIQLINKEEVMYSKPKILPPPLRENLKKHIQMLRDEDVVEDAKGPHAARAVGVPKKDGTIRWCGAFLKLNKNTKSENFPIPLIRGMHEAAVKAQVFGAADMVRGYNQAVVDEESRKLLAIITEDDYVQYKHVPFGIKNATSYFQREMTKAFKDLLYTACVIYVDDIVILGKNDVDYVENVRNVFQRCRDYRLRLKATKLVLGMDNIESLGMIITHNGKSINPARVAAIRSLPKPMTCRQLRSLLGQFSYLRDFLPNYAALSQPLYDMLPKQLPLKKGNQTPITWNEEADASYQKLLDMICSDVTLACGTEGDLILMTDASQLGIGGVLLVRTPEGERPVCYMSKALTSSQKKWATIDLEVYALYYFLTQSQYKEILRTQRVEARVDHKNILYMEKAANNNPRIYRMLAKMGEYDLVLRHISGKTNVIADYLSRAPFEQAAAQPVEEVNMIMDVTKKIEEAPKNPKVASELIEQFHNHLEGHHGVNLTLDAMKKEGYVWQGLDKDVQNFVKSCPVCQKVRLRRVAKFSVLTTSTFTSPFQEWAVDSMGPLPEVDGYKYILVVQCMFSRWTEIVPLKTLTAEEAAEAFIASIFARYYLPDSIRSDNGTQFVNGVIEHMLRQLKVQHHRIVAYHPQSNGQIERRNQEVIRHIRCIFLNYAVVY